MDNTTSNTINNNNNNNDNNDNNEIIEIIETYKKLNDKCDGIIKKIKDKKQSLPKQGKQCLTINQNSKLKNK